MWKSVAAVLVAVLVAALAAASALGEKGDEEREKGTEPPVHSRGSSPSLSLSDDAGRTIRLSRAPQRIVSLAPHATELLFAVGAGARVVAVDRNSDEPPAARALPKLSSFPQPDVEALLALRPDLVVAWGPGVSPAQLERLESLGIPVFVSQPHTLDDVASTLRRFALLAPDPSIGKALADAFAARLASIRSRYSRLRPVRVFVQIWSSPLITVSDEGPIGDAVRSCGGVNVFGDVNVAAPQPDAEAVLARRPDLIVATDPSPSPRRWIGYGLLSPQGPAHFVAFDASTFERPGPRSIDALDSLCAEIDAVRRSMPR
ncbi:MAG: cobalamin-binding protein [Burkholderiaceae bacterium]|jgi:ABC-type Fe3+-hydroxamate transport system substrate-binding protein|nr:cobalamin-binding protein [Burkholderiaceae bacterium]